MSNTIPIIETRKLKPLKHNNELIDRSRLLVYLSHINQKKCCIINAPMGSGKTVLLSQFYREQKPIKPMVWLSLDKNDIDPTRFFLHLTQAIQKALPDFNRQVIFYHSEANDENDKPLQQLFLDELNHQPIAPTIIIDNLQYLEDCPWCDALLNLIEQSESVHWILSGQNQYALKTNQWRNREDIVYLDQNELYFTPEEIKSYLQQASLEDNIENFLDVIQQHTLGWPTGVKLAQLYLSKLGPDYELDATINGSRLFQNITNHIIDHMEPDTQFFMINTCFLDHFNQELAEYILNKKDFRKAIAELESTRFFLEKSTDEALCYHYPPLIQNLLLKRFNQQSSDFKNRLISKASIWLTENRHRAAACRVAEMHSVDSFFIEFLRQCFVYWLKAGDVKSIFNWIREHRGSQLLAVEDIRIAWCWALTLSGEVTAAEHALKTYFLGDSPNASISDRFSTALSPLTANTLVLQATIRLLKNQLNPTDIQCLLQLYKLPNVSNDLRASINNVLAQFHSAQGDFIQALSYSEKALKISEQHDHMFSYSIAALIKVRLLYFNNDIQGALNACDGLLLHNKQPSTLINKAVVAGIKSFLLRITDQPLQANELSHELLVFNEPNLSVDLQYYTYLPILRWQIHQGNDIAANQILDFLHQTAHNSGSEQYLAEMYFEYFRFAAIKNHTHELNRLAEETDLEQKLALSLSDRSPYAWATRERWIKAAIIFHISQNAFELAQQLTHQLVTLNVENGYPVHHLPIIMIQVWLTYCQGQPNMAFIRLNEALSQTIPDGVFLGLFDEIPGIEQLVDDALAKQKIENPAHVEKLMSLGFGR